VRERCATEIQAGLEELREAIQRPLGRRPVATRTTLRERLDELAAERGVQLDEGADVAVPAALEPLTQSVVAEAVRNARKHAEASRIGVRLRHAEGALVLTVVNDGVAPASMERNGRGGGMGLRLAAFEALQHGGVLEFGPRGTSEWQVRLTVPVEDA
jgi:signal transduction histidine kinase